MHSRRARPTLRVLRDDLRSGWATPFVRRTLDSGDLRDLGALSELDHPLISKALEVFGPDGDQDSPEGLIRSATQFPLWEVKVAQWRGAVWRDPEGVCWLVAAGLAKGGHEDRDDFYARVARTHAEKRAGDWLPADQDRLGLKQETAARLLLEWQLDLQRSTASALEAAILGRATTFEIPHPAAERLPKHEAILALATVSMTEVRDGGTPTDDVLVEVRAGERWAGSNLWWQAATRVIVTIAAPEQAWDYDGTTFSTIGEPESWAHRLTELSGLIECGVLAESEPGSHAHYAHRRHLAGCTVEGSAVRAMCGAFFVPRQDHDSLPVCPRCDEERERLPK